jgi:hypothetical protein
VAIRSRYLCVTIDTECDKGAGWKVEKPLGFAGIKDGVGQRLAPLFRRHRAKGTYLLSPEIMRHDESVSLMRSLAKESDLGTHLHAELAEPGAHVPDETAAFQRDCSEAEERAKLTTLTDAFKTAFDRAPTCFRAGRFGVGPNSVPILESLGYEVESIVTPHMEWSSAGAPGLDFRGAPTQPYHPDPAMPGRRGNAAIWEVPVTIRPSALSRVPIIGKLAEPRWLRPTRGSEESIVQVAKDELAEAERNAEDRPAILCAMFHNVEVVPGKSPYAKDESGARAILSRLSALLSFCEREGVSVIGLSDLPEILNVGSPHSPQ